MLHSFQPRNILTYFNSMTHLAKVFFMSLAASLLLAWVFIAGLMYLWNPQAWARSWWSLYPPWFLEDLERPAFRLMMRFTGLFFVVFCCVFGWPPILALLGAIRAGIRLLLG